MYSSHRSYPRAQAERRESPPGKTGHAVATLVRTKVQRPEHYRVLMLNDDYTPMDFVVRLLERVFHKSQEEAINLMLQVHHAGQAVCGEYSHDIAETKVALVLKRAREHQHPLRCTMEKR